MDADKQRGPADLGSEQIAKANQDKGLLEVDLRDVCASKGFELEYQPQVNLCTQRVTTFEALLRWRHPVRGNVPPDEFIPLAEEIGLIGEIGQWVLERACQDAVAWPADIHLRSMYRRFNSVMHQCPQLWPRPSGFPVWRPLD